jgi:hypothetical protein
MGNWDKKLALLAFLNGRIYRILSAIAGLCLLQLVASAQEINAYKTISSGNFSNILIWNVFDGSTWVPTTTLPDSSNDIYIDQNHTLTLNLNAAVKNVFINSETGAGQKLRLNSFNLDIYGSLQAFSGAAPGTPSGTWNSQNWIGNSFNSTITFKGESRIIIPLNAWSGFSTNSRYSVIFDPGPGVELIIEEPFKALSFTVKSGTLRQKLDRNVFPNFCPTLSFNTETTVYGTGPFGVFTIEPGATFISDCNTNIIFRSNSSSADLFDLQANGIMVLEGTNPRIEAANFQLNGKIIFRGGDSPKNFLNSSFADAGIPNRIHDLELQGVHNLNLPTELFISGNMVKTGTGNILSNNSHIFAVGPSEQNIGPFPMTVSSLTIQKAGGRIRVSDDLTITRTLYMNSGSLDLSGNILSINSSSQGGINYSGGSWRNAALFRYFNIPTSLDEVNGTFPFEDTKNGGVRKVQLLGNTAGGNLEIRFTEYKGAEYNSNFDDSDGTPILYRLFSFFQFSGLNPNSNPMELRISADQLIVDDVDDLRIVGTGYAAQGSHLDGLDPTLLWARRLIQLEDLAIGNYTVGSFRTLSILPVEWINFEAIRRGSEVSLNWEILGEQEYTFEIYRSDGNISNWRLIGSASKSLAGASLFQFSDINFYNHESYYRIKSSNQEGHESWSNTVRVTPLPKTHSSVKIYPNPYFSGPIHIEIPEKERNTALEVELLTFTGDKIHEGKIGLADLEKLLIQVNPGNYILRVSQNNNSWVIRWIRK